MSIPSSELLELMGKLIIGDNGMGNFRGSSGGSLLFAKAGWTVTSSCPGTGWETWASEQLRQFRTADEKAVEKVLQAMSRPDEFLNTENRVKQQERRARIRTWNGHLAPYGLTIVATDTSSTVEPRPPGLLSDDEPDEPLRSAVAGTPRKPYVFIGSSAEGHKIAEALQHALDYETESTIWSQDVFRLSKSNLENLVESAGKFDFAILVLTPDDLVEKRESRERAPRDNVLFELGLFMGRLGRERTFMAYCRDIPLDLPSDLDGIAAAKFAKRRDNNLQAAVGAACVPIKAEIARVGLRADLR